MRRATLATCRRGAFGLRPAVITPTRRRALWAMREVASNLRASLMVERISLSAGRADRSHQEPRVFRDALRAAAGMLRAVGREFLVGVGCAAAVLMSWTVVADAARAAAPLAASGRLTSRAAVVLPGDVATTAADPGSWIV